LSISAYHQLFVQLDRFLFNHQEYWRYQPFQLVTRHNLGDFPWHNTNRLLCQHLEQLNDVDVEQLRQHGDRLEQWISPHIQSLSAWLEQVSFPCSTAEDPTLQSLNASVYNGIPGRKVAQLNAMASTVLEQHKGKRWLEWCAGKGYLGRIIAAVSRQEVISFEFQTQLCQEGQEIARQKRLPMTFVQGDAFLPAAKSVFNSDMHALALHACGDLHVRLLEYGCEKRLPAITIAPCCYHLTQSEEYQPLSTAYRDALLSLSREELRIPLQETVTGGERVKRHRQIEMTYRLGFDLIVKHELNQEEYLPVPSIKKSFLADGFVAFCHWAAEQKGYLLADIDFDNYLLLAENKFTQMEKLALVQQAFFPLIEAWIILDKVIYLEEQGYRVTVMRFCDKFVTPRNILIHAELAEK
jgi:hypothetical protein